MSCRKTWTAGLIVLAVASSPKAKAQVPAAGAVPGGAANAAPAALGGAGAGAGLGAPAAAVPAAAAAPRTVWGMLGLSSANIHACIAKLCGTQLGQMANNMLTGPVGAVSGGFIPPLCPVAPSPAQIAALESQAPG